MLDTAIVRAHEIFQPLDVWPTPTTPQSGSPFSTPTPVNQADLTSFANFSGLPVGLQLIGPFGSDLALIELSEVIEAELG